MSDDYGQSVVAELRTKLAASVIENSETWDEVVRLESRLEEDYGIGTCTPSSRGSTCGGCRNCKTLRNELQTIRSTNTELQQLRHEYSSAVDERIELHSELATLHTNDLSKANILLMSELSNTKEELLVANQKYETLESRYQVVVSELREEISILRNRTPSSVTPARMRSFVADLNENDESLHSMQTPTPKTVNQQRDQFDEMLPQSCGRNAQSRMINIETDKQTPSKREEVNDLKELVRKLRHENESQKQRHSILISELREEVSTLRKNNLTPKKYVNSSELDITPISTSKRMNRSPASYDRLKEENDSLKQHRHRHNLIISELREEVSTLRRNCLQPSPSVADRLQQLQNENEVLKRHQNEKITSLEDELRELRESIPSNVPNHDTTEILLLKSELTAAQDEADDAKEELANLRTQFSQNQNSSDDDLAAVTAECDQMKRMIHDLKAELQASANDDRVAELLEVVAEKEQLIIRCKEKDDLISKSEAARELLQHELHELRLSLQNDRSEHHEKDQIIETLRAQLASLKDAASDESPSAKKVAELESRVAELFEQKDTEIDQLTEQNTLKNKQIRELSTENTALKSENTTRVTELETRVAELFEQKDSEIVFQQDRINELESDASAKAAQIVELQQLVDEQRAHITNSKAQLEQNKKLITLGDKAIEDNRNLTKSIEESESMNQDLENQLSKLFEEKENVAATLREENARLRFEYEKLTTQCDAVVTDLEAELSDLRGKHTSTTPSKKSSSPPQYELIMSKVRQEITLLENSPQKSPQNDNVTALRDEIGRYEIIVEELENEIAALRVMDTPNKSTTIDNENLRIEIDSLKSQLQSTQQLYDDLKTRNPSINVNGSNSFQNSLLEEAHNQIDALRLENAVLQEKVAKQQQSETNGSTSMNSMFEEAQTQIDDLRIENALLKEKIASQIDTKQSPQRTPHSDPDHDDSLFDVISNSPKDSSNTSSTKKHNELIDEVYRLRRDNLIQTDTMNSLQTEVRTLKSDNTELAKQLHTQIENTFHLNEGSDSRHDKLESEAQELREKLSAQNVQLQEMKASLNTAQEQLNESKDIAGSHLARIQSLRTEVVELQNQLSDAEKAATATQKSHQKELLACEQSNKILEKRINILSEENSQLAAIAEDQKPNDGAEAKIEALQLEISSLTSQLNIKKDELQSANIRTETLTGCLDRFTEEAAQSGIEISSLQKDNEKATTRLEAASEQNNKLQATVNELQHELRNHLNTADENQRLKLEQEEHISDCKKAMQDAVLLSTEVSRLRDIETKLQETVCKLNVEKESSRSLQEEVNACALEIKKQTSSIETLKSENTKLTSETKKLRQQLNTATASEYGEEIDVMRETNSVLGKEVAALTKEVLHLRRLQKHQQTKPEVACP